MNYPPSWIFSPSEGGDSGAKKKCGVGGRKWERGVEFLFCDVLTFLGVGLHGEGEGRG